MHRGSKRVIFKHLTKLVDVLFRFFVVWRKSSLQDTQVKVLPESGRDLETP